MPFPAPASLLLWPMAFIIGFVVALLTLGAELLFTVVGQIVGLVPIESAQTLIEQSLVFLAFIAILEEIVKFLTVQTFHHVTGRLAAVSAGLGFSLVEPLLLWSFQPDVFALSHGSLLPNILLHTALFSLYAAAMHRKRALARLALVFGSLLHIGANILSAESIASAPILVGSVSGVILAAILLLPKPAAPDPDSELAR